MSALRIKWLVTPKLKYCLFAASDRPTQNSPYPNFFINIWKLYFYFQEIWPFFFHIDIDQFRNLLKNNNLPTFLPSSNWHGSEVANKQFVNGGLVTNLSDTYTIVIKRLVINLKELMGTVITSRHLLTIER